MTGSTRADIVIVGGGHNGLVAAADLAQAGLSVTVLERLGSVGGAAVSAFAFEGVEAGLSRYSDLVSLLPARVIHDLKLDIPLARRRYPSYAPLPGTERGPLVDTVDATATDTPFRSIGADSVAWNTLYDDTADLESGLALPGGHIFLAPPSWPFADDASLSTAAERCGVATEHERILLCGAGAVRGGGVSGIGGHNAAMAVLEDR